MYEVYKYEINNRRYRIIYEAYEAYAGPYLGDVQPVNLLPLFHPYLTADFARQTLLF